MKKYFVVEMEVNDETYPASTRAMDENWVTDQLTVLGVNEVQVEAVTEREVHNNYKHGHSRPRK